MTFFNLPVHQDNSSTEVGKAGPGVHVAQVRLHDTEVVSLASTSRPEQKLDWCVNIF